MFCMRMRSFLAVVVWVLNSPRHTTAVKLDEYTCGFEQTCKGNFTDADRIAGSCCKACECTDICEERDTCCSNKELLSDTRGVVKQECLPVLYLPPGIETRQKTQTYFTRSRCPSTFTDLNIKEKCENLTPNALEDIPFVSSEDGTIVYKNRFCGLCHGEKRTIAWTVKVELPKCLNEITESDATLDETLLNFCPLVFTEPDNLDPRSTICVDKTKVINQCNTTKQWEVYDSDLESMCLHSPQSVYFYDVKVAFSSRYVAVYSNVYCYLCNAQSNTAPSTCNVDHTSEKVVKSSLFNLINQDLWKKSEDVNKTLYIVRESNRCRKDEILDTFYNTCRTLYCPKFFLPVNGKCVAFLDDSLCYFLGVKLLPIAEMKKSESIKNELKTKLFSIQRKLGFGKCESSYTLLCLKRGIDEKELSEIFVKFILSTTGKCKAEHMWSRLAKIQTSPPDISILLDGTMIKFKVVFTNISVPKTADYEAIHSVATNLFCISLYYGRNCPRVRLTMMEYKTALQRHASARELLFVPGEDDTNDTMYVCCDKYISEPLATGVRIKASAILSILALIIVILEKTY